MIERIIMAFIVWTVVISLVLVVFFFVVMFPVAVTTSAECLEYGFPHHSVTWKFEKYCMREVDETEYVCTLVDIRNGDCILSGGK